MSKKNNNSQVIPEKYHLKTNKTISGRYWQIDDIYLSDVCLVVIVKPVVGKERNTGSPAKEELFAIMRGITSRVLHHDLMRPLAAFIQGGDDQNNCWAAWGADQEWHRGAFTLYVEATSPSTENKKKLVPTAWELLEPEFKSFVSNEYKERSPCEIIENAYKTITSPSTELRRLYNLLKEMLDGNKNEADKKKRLSILEESIKSWQGKICDELNLKV